MTNALNTTANLNVNAFNATETGAFTLNGFDQTVNALLGFAGGIVRNNSATIASTLTVGNGGGTNTFNGTIVNGAAATLALVKTGSGNQTLSGINTYTGGTRIDAGTLTLGNATNTLANTGAVNVNGGILALGTNIDTVGAVTLTDGSITGTGTALQGVLTGTGSAFDVRKGSVSAKLAGTVGLTKTTADTVTLSATNTYSGATNVNGGTLLINGNISTSSLTTVNDGATLGGTGTVGALSVAANGILAPGLSPGTLNTGTVSLVGLSNLNFELNPTDIAVGGGTNDLVSVTGNLTLDGILNLTPTSGDFLSVTLGTAWRLFNYTGSLTDNTLGFGTMPSLGSGLSWSINTATTGQVNLVVIPEPSAALLCGLGLLALLRRRRN